MKQKCEAPLISPPLEPDNSRRQAPHSVSDMSVDYESPVLFFFFKKRGCLGFDSKVEDGGCETFRIRPNIWIWEAKARDKWAMATTSGWMNPGRSANKNEAKLRKDYNCQPKDANLNSLSAWILAFSSRYANSLSQASIVILWPHSSCAQARNSLSSVTSSPLTSLPLPSPLPWRLPGRLLPSQVAECIINIRTTGKKMKLVYWWISGQLQAVQLVDWESIAQPAYNNLILQYINTKSIIEKNNDCGNRTPAK